MTDFDESEKWIINIYLPEPVGGQTVSPMESIWRHSFRFTLRSKQKNHKLTLNLKILEVWKVKMNVQD